jgi:hypothetical protein
MVVSRDLEGRSSIFQGVIPDSRERVKKTVKNENIVNGISRIETSWK